MNNAPRTISGKSTILTFASVSLLMAAGAWWYYYDQQRRPMALWGPGAARLIAQAPHVEAWQLADPQDPAAGEAIDGVLETMIVGGQRLRVAARRDASQAPGLSHLRKALMNDGCFAWDAKKPGQAIPWRYALRFTDNVQQATLLFTEDARRVQLLENGGEASLSPVAEGIATFLKEQFPEEPIKTRTSTE